MKIKTVELAATAFNKSQYPVDGLPQLAVVGRSNVGKSSLINAVLNRKNFAKVSSKPGKTRGINFYKINQCIYLVDLPGYGYAEVSKEMKRQWAKNIETYLDTSSNLRHALLLIDIRRIPTDDDLLMADWFRHKGIQFTVVATKSDKLNRSEINKSIETISKELGIKREDIIIFSSLKRLGLENVISIFDKYV